MNEEKDDISHRPRQGLLNSSMKNLLLCPISSVFMDKAVSDECGHTFQEEAIRKWLEKSKTCPMTGDLYKITPPTLRPNFAVRDMATRQIRQEELRQVDLREEEKNEEESDEENATKCSKFGKCTMF
jgi:hypothetical protein